MRTTRIWLIIISVAFWVSASNAADTPHWTTHYSRFGGVKPRAEFERLSREFFEKTIIPKAVIDAPSLNDAIPQIREIIRKAGFEWGLSVIIFNPDYAGFHTHLHIKASNLSLAKLINELAKQGDFYWDFSAIKLTLRPKKYKAM